MDKASKIPSKDMFTFIIKGMQNKSRKQNIFSYSLAEESKNPAIIYITGFYLYLIVPLTAESCNQIKDFQMLLIGGTKLTPPIFIN